METLQLILVLSLISYNIIQCTEICDVHDTECLTAAARCNYLALITGVGGQAESSDPLRLAGTSGETSSLRYSFTNFELTGMADCDISVKSVSADGYSFAYLFECPELVATFDYDLHGTVGPYQLNGQDSATVTTDNYDITYTGRYGTIVDDSDQSVRVYIANITSIDLNPRGRSSIETGVLVEGDEEQSEQAKQYMNDNASDIIEMFRSSLVHNLFSKILMNISDGMKTFRVEDLIAKECTV